jgi:hypothetical protein
VEGILRECGFVDRAALQLKVEQPILEKKNTTKLMTFPKTP